MGGREVGGLANQLAAHLHFDRAGDAERLRRFWQAPRLATGPGLKAVDLFDAVHDGRVKALWIVATNPADSMPRADHVREALARCPFVVVSDCWPTDTSRHAHVVLPAAGWGEKDGTVTNSERRISRQRRFRDAPGEARPDWWMFAEVARRMGFAPAFAWDGPAAIFREHAALSHFENDGARAFDIAAMAPDDDAGYEQMAPQLWPAGSERLFGDGGFSTPDGRARCIPTPYRALSAPTLASPTLPSPTLPSPTRAFLLNTGRVRDQWHTMTRTGRVPRLMTHTPEPTLALNPADAARLDLASGDLARVATDAGHAVLRVAVTTAQRPGTVFAPMHWTDTHAATGPIGRAVTARCDPHSGQPELKATPASIRRVAVAVHGLLFRRQGGALPGPWHWTRVPLDNGHLYRLASTGALAATDALFGPLPAHVEWIEMEDAARGVLRRAALVDGVLEACLLLAADAAALPQPESIAPLLGTVIPDHQRWRVLIGGRTGQAAETGPLVCACFGVGRAAICRAVREQNLRTTRDIGASLNAGTNCGSCVPELQAILRDLHSSPGYQETIAWTP
jgi:assimilatory nitrate reductase catalytic subunit